MFLISLSDHGYSIFPGCFLIASVSTTTNDKTHSGTYIWSPFSKLTIERHFNFLLVSSSLIKGLAHFKRWTVQVETDSCFGMAWVLHTMQTNGVYKE